MTEIYNGDSRHLKRKHVHKGFSARFFTNKSKLHIKLERLVPGIACKLSRL